MAATCSVDGCDRPVKGRGWCRRHYARWVRTGSTELSRPTIEERLWAKVDKNGPVPGHKPELGPCWVWTGSTNGKGYGMIGREADAKPRSLLVHRLAWELANGTPPGEGLLVCHHCDNRLCVRATHLFLGTAKDNSRDMAAKGRQWKQGMPRRTHCPAGHRFTDENTYTARSGARSCRECGRASSRRHYDRQRSKSRGSRS